MNDIGTGEDVFGYNLYSYCWNSPLGKADHDGHDPRALTLTLEMSTLLAAFQTVQAVMAGVSVGSVAVTGAAVFVATAATVHNVVMCKKLVDAIVDAVEDEENGTVGKKIQVRLVKKLMIQKGRLLTKRH